MVLRKKKVIIPALKDKKPTKFRFKGDLRIGFRDDKVVELIQFENVKRRKKKK